MRVVAIVTTIASILLLELIEALAPEWVKSIRLVSVAPLIALAMTLLVTSRVTSRALWHVARLLNDGLYPDLNGTWEGEIQTATGETIPARAVIRQALLSTQIDMHTATAKSVTLEATPVTEGGQFKLYYSYRAKPKKVGFGAYTGTTIFDIRLATEEGDGIVELSGYYYTDRKTLGTTHLRRINGNTNRDVSFY